MTSRLHQCQGNWDLQTELANRAVKKILSACKELYNIFYCPNCTILLARCKEYKVFQETNIRCSGGLEMLLDILVLPGLLELLPGNSFACSRPGKNQGLL